MRNSGNGRITFHLKIYSHLVWQVAQAIHCSSFMGIWASMDNLIRSYGNFSLYHFPEKRTGQKSRDDCFYLQLILNFLWTVIFFGMRSPFAALIEIFTLWIFIAVTIILFWNLSPVAALLLVPYLLWTSFASVLNYQFWKINH